MLRPPSPPSPCPAGRPFELPISLRQKDVGESAGGGSKVEEYGVVLSQDKLRCIIGRGPKCDVQMGLISISKHHAEISASPGGTTLSIRNLSRNADTRVNHVELVGLEEKLPLQDGDEVTIGGRIERTYVVSCPGLALLRAAAAGVCETPKKATTSKLFQTPTEGNTPFQRLNRSSANKLTIVQKSPSSIPSSRLHSSPSPSPAQSNARPDPAFPSPAPQSPPASSPEQSEHAATHGATPGAQSSASTAVLYHHEGASTPSLSEAPLSPAEDGGHESSSPSPILSSAGSAISLSSLGPSHAHNSLRMGAGAAKTGGSVAALGVSREGTPFFLFCRERSPVMRADNPTASITEQAWVLSEQWKAMSEEDKDRYRRMAGGTCTRPEAHSLFPAPTLQPCRPPTRSPIPETPREVTPADGASPSSRPTREISPNVAGPPGGEGQEGRGVAIVKRGIAVMGPTRRDAVFFAVGAAAAAALVVALRR